MSSMMKAAILHKPGPPSALKIEQIAIPIPSSDQVLIRIGAFGLNRSEMFTRQGHSMNVVTLPRVLGIEAVGTVVNSPDKSFEKGDIVATAMGGMGRAFDGGYAEYTCPPANQVQLLAKRGQLKIPWETLGALPEMIQTAWGSLHKGLHLKRGDRIAGRIARGDMHIEVGKVMRLDQIVEAHELMESNKAGGKIVLLP